MSLLCRRLFSVVVGMLRAARGRGRALGNDGSGAPIVRRVLVMVVSACALLAVGSASAGAATTHSFVGSFGSFGFVGGVAVDSSGDVYVADAGSNSVQKFDASGNSVNFSGLGSNTLTGAGTPAGSFSFSYPAAVAVDNSTTSASAGDIYVLDAGHHVVDKFSSAGSYLGQLTGTPSGSFGGINGIGVDGAGNVYVDENTRQVDKFDGSAGNAFVQSFPYPYGSDPGFAADPGGDYYTIVRGSPVVEKWDSSGNDLGQFDNSGNGAAVAVDPVTGHVYVDDIFAVAEWDTSAMNSSRGVPGTLVSQFAGAISNGSGPFSLAIGVSPVTGDVYVPDRQGRIEIYGPDIIIPDVSTGSASNIQPSSATLNGSVDPAGGGNVTSCQFEYVDQADYNPNTSDPYSAGHTAACSPPTPYSSPTSVSADISNLQPNTTYHYRLDAGNANGSNQGQDGTFETTGPPTVDSTAGSGASSSSVTLHAQIDPHGFDTTYHFEYGTSTSYGTSVPIPDADIGAGSSDVAVSQTVTGLSPMVDYHYRVVATNSAGPPVDGPDRIFAASPSPAPLAANSSSCPNAQYRTGPSAGLPDCRAYELVTPANQSGSPDQFGDLVLPEAMGSSDGNRVLLISATAKFGPHPGPAENAYVFSRTSGWTMTMAQPSGADSIGYYDEIFSPDLTNLGLSTTPIQDTKGQGLADNALVAGPVGGPYTQIVGKEPIPNTFQEETGTIFRAATPDFSHLLVESEDHGLAPGAAGQVADSAALYEWSGGHMQLVNVNGDGSLTSACGARLGNEYVSGNGTLGDEHGNEHAISSDGSKIFFVSPDPTATFNGATDASCTQPAELYMRDTSTGTTVDISCPANVPDPGGCRTFHSSVGHTVGAEFAGASADGSKVFFIAATELTADDTGHDPELYEYDTTTGALTRVSRGASGTADGNVDWALVSDDGSAVYFGAWGDLAPGAASDPQASNEENVYRYDTSTGSTGYVATIGDFNASETDPEFRYTTPDGKFLLFESSTDVTGYQSGNRQVYRYDAADGSVLCVSCNPGGASKFSGVGFSDLGASFGALDPEQLVGASADPDGRRPRPMSDDGQYVFFETPDQLVPQDTNVPSLSCNANLLSITCADDVYEWHNGQVSLISSGTSPDPAYFIDSSPDGRDVFFATHSDLVAQANGFDEGNIYDARIGGGFPAPAAPAGCSGDGCQGPLASAPALPTAASVTFSGPGDTSPGSAPASPAHPSVLTRTVRGGAFLVKVGVPGQGRITIAGAGLNTVRRSVSNAGTYPLRVTLTAGESRLLARRHELKLTLRVGYAPPGAGARTATVRLTVLPAVRHGRRATSSTGRAGT